MLSGYLQVKIWKSLLQLILPLFLDQKSRVSNMANPFCTFSVGEGTNLLIDRVLVTPGSARFREDVSELKILMLVTSLKRE